jgi:hypothetical protein
LSPRMAGNNSFDARARKVVPQFSSPDRLPPSDRAGASCTRSHTQTNTQTHVRGIRTHSSPRAYLGPALLPPPMDDTSCPANTTPPSLPGATCSSRRTHPPHFAASAPELWSSHTSSPVVTRPASASAMAAETACEGASMSQAFLPTTRPPSRPVAATADGLHSSTRPAKHTRQRSGFLIPPGRLLACPRSHGDAVRAEPRCRQAHARAGTTCSNAQVSRHSGHNTTRFRKLCKQQQPPVPLRAHPPAASVRTCTNLSACSSSAVEVGIEPPPAGGRR